MSAQGIALGLGTRYQEALKGRNKQSIPNVPFVKTQMMATQEHPKLFLKRHRSMMLFLLLNVPPHLTYLRLAHGKRTVSVLPTERRKRRPLRLDPFRGPFLHLFHNLAQRMVLGQYKQRMDMVESAADDCK